MPQSCEDRQQPEPRPRAAGGGAPQSQRRPQPWSAPPAHLSGGSCALGSSGLAWELPAERGRKACFPRTLAHALCRLARVPRPPRLGSPSPSSLSCRVHGAPGGGPLGHGQVGQLHREGAGVLPGKGGAPAPWGSRVSLVGVPMTQERPPSPTQADRCAQHRLRLPPAAPSPGRRPVWDRAGLQRADTASRPSAEFGAHRV